jgi:hypothetical protein
MGRKFFQAELERARAERIVDLQNFTSEQLAAKTTDGASANNLDKEY